MKQRILTAIVGIAVLALAIWKIDTVIFVCAIALACIFISIEVQNAVKTKNKPLKVVCAVYAASIPFLFAFASLEQFHLLPAVSLLFFILISCILLKDHRNIRVKMFFAAFFGSLVVPLCLSTIIRIGNPNPFLDTDFTLLQGIYLTVFAFCCSWLTDAFAYFVGSKFGKHKMCPKISPKKSIEGAVGGFVLSVIFNGGIYLLVDNFAFELKDNISFVAILVLSGVCAALSMIGDLMASVIKRDCDIKDFGNIMPGHGGMTDRFDSCIFVFPTIYFAICYGLIG
ncbi:MAG: phosphatidate cytidylyltransferase [Clostridia bacterium]|nr:phosphatidate cytidylyltransferase [Clostridia bacterium]